MKFLFLTGPIFLLSCTNGGSLDPMGNWYCGAAFAVDLREGETLTSYDDTPEDFQVYSFGSGAASASIYEGNFPQPGGAEFKTGRDWPAVVSITGDPALIKRVKVVRNLPENCAAATAERDR